jgi:hypothetical protein
LLVIPDFLARTIIWLKPTHASKPKGVFFSVKELGELENLKDFAKCKKGSPQIVTRYSNTNK